MRALRVSVPVTDEAFRRRALLVHHSTVIRPEATRPHYRSRRRRISRRRVRNVWCRHMLVQTDVGQRPQLTQHVRDISWVKTAADVTGPYDIVVRAEAEDMDALSSLVVARIQRLDGIARTLTCPIVTI